MECRQAYLSIVRLIVILAAMPFSHDVAADDHAIALRIRAAELREVTKTRPEFKEKLIRDNPALKAYLEGNTKLSALKPSELKSLSRLYSQEASASEQGLKALMSALGGSGTAKSVAAELAETAQNHSQKVTEDYVTRIFDRRRNSATTFAAEVHNPKYGLLPERIAALCEPFGAIDRLMSANFPETNNAAAIRAHNFRELMLIERKAAQLSGDGEMENVRLAKALQEVARMSIRDKDMLNEIAKVIEEATANPNGEVALALDGLRLVAVGIEYAKSEYPDAMDAFARSVASELGMVESIKNEIIANESKLFDRALAPIVERSSIDISSAKTMGDLVALCELAIGRETNLYRKAALQGMQDRIHAMRLLAAMESSSRYKKMAPPEKVLLMSSMLRAANLTSASARVGAVAAVNIVSGIGFQANNDVLSAKMVESNWKGKELTENECVALAKQLKVPEYILSGASASAYRTALSAVAPSKTPPR